MPPAPSPSPSRASPFSPFRRSPMPQWSPQRVLWVLVGVALLVFVFSSIHLSHEGQPPGEEGFGRPRSQPVYYRAAGEGGAEEERQTLMLKNISSEITSARQALAQIHAAIETAKLGMARLIGEMRSALPGGATAAPGIQPSASAETRPEPKANEPRAGEVRPHMSFDMCLDGVDEKMGAVPYLCHGKGGNQYWRWTKSGQLSSTGLCLDATGVKASGRVRLTACRTSNPGQRFTYSYGGLWYPAGPITSLHNGMCLSSPIPHDIDQESVTMEECDGSCRQKWMVNAPFFNGTTLVRRMARYKKPVLKANTENGDGRLLCWVMTNPRNHGTKAKTVAETWGRSCDILLFVSTEQVPEQTTFVVDLEGEKESRDMLWKKSQAAWMHLFFNYLDKAEWFLRGDDDTLILMDNLREFLSHYNHTEKHFFGRRFVAPEDNATFYSGGPGTILSQTTLRALGEAVEREEPNTIFGPANTFADDVEVALSLFRLGILTEDTRDDEGRARFISLGLDPERSLSRKREPNHWFWVYEKVAQEGMDCCSKRWIGTHYVAPHDMRQLEDMHEVGCEGAGKDPF